MSSSRSATLGVKRVRGMDGNASATTYSFIDDAASGVYRDTTSGDTVVHASKRLQLDSTEQTIVLPDDTLTIQHTGNTALVIESANGYVQIEAMQVSGNTITSAMTFQENIVVPEPTAANHPATKFYTDAIASGLSLKRSCRAATTEALPAYTVSDNTLTATANGALPAIDGVTLLANDRVLVKNESASQYNGIYTVDSVGSVSTPWALTRATDADNSPGQEVSNGMFTFLSEGDTQQYVGYALMTDSTVVLNTTPLTFEPFSNFGLEAVSPIVRSGVQLSLSTVPVSVGGTGATTAANARVNLGVDIGTDVQAHHVALDSIAGLTTAANTMIYTTGANTYATTALTAYARTLLDDANATVARATLGVVPGTDVQTQSAALQSIASLTTSANETLYTTGADTYATTAMTAFGRSLIDDANAAVAQSTLGLVPGTDVQAHHAALDSIAALTTAANTMIYATASDTYATATLTPYARTLLDDANATVARATLGLVVGTDVQAYDAALDSIAALATSADQMLYTTGADTYATTPISAFGRSLLDDANASVAWSTLNIVPGVNVQAQDAGLQSIADLETDANEMLYTTGADAYATTALSAFARTLLDDANAAVAQATLGLVPGTDVQTQAAALQSIADLTTAANEMLYTTGADTYATTALSAFGRSLIDDANAAVARTTLGLVPGTDVQTQAAALQSIADLTTDADEILYTTGADTYATTALSAFGRTLIDDANATVARTTLGLVPGTDVQAHSAALDSIAAQVTSGNTMIYATGADTYATTTLSYFARELLDDADAASMRLTLGLEDVQGFNNALASIANLTTYGGEMIYTTATDTYATSTLTAFGRSLVDDANATVARATLGVVIGTDVQAQDAGLQSIADLATSADQMIYTTGSDAYATATLTPFARTLLDDVDAANVHATLGLVPGTDVQAHSDALDSIAALTTAANTMIYATGADTYATSTLTPYARTLLDDANASVARETLGLVLGTDVQAHDDALDSIAALATTANEMLYTTGADTYATTALTAFARTLLDDVDAANARLTLGISEVLGESLTSINQLTATADAYLYATEANTFTTGTITSFGRSLVDDANASVARATLGVVIGTNVQAQDAGLQSIADLATSADQMLYTTGADAYATTAVTAFGRSLLDDANATVARSTLGVVIGTDVQAQDAGLQSIAALTTSANEMLYTTGADTYATTTLTAFGRSLIDDANASVARATLGLVPGTDVQTQDAALQSIADLTTDADEMLYTTGADTYATTALSAFGRSLIDDADASAARSTLGVVPGTDVQAHHGALDSIASLAPSGNQMIYATAGDTYGLTPLTAFARTLLDDADVTEAQTTLGVLVGTDVQAHGAALDSIAALSTSMDQILYTTGPDAYATTAISAFGRSLIDDANATVARSTLGVVIGTNVQAQDTGLQSIADLATTADQMLYTTGSDAYATTDVTAFGRSLLDDANATVAQATLGLVPGTDVQTQDAALQSIADLTTGANEMLYTTGADTYATTTLTAFARTLLDDANAAVARATLGVVPGTDVQAQDAGLQSIADLATSADQILYTTNTDTYATTAISAFGRSLIDDANATVARATLGVVIGTNVQAHDTALQSIADLATSADQMLYTTGADAYATTTVTSFGRSLLDDANATVARATLGLVPGTDVQTQDAALQSIADLSTGANEMLYTTGADTYATTALSAFGRSLIDDANATVARATLGLVPGTDVQAQDAALQSIADLSTGANEMLYTTGADTYATTTLSAFARTLLDDADAETARLTLGIAAVLGESLTSINDLTVASDSYLYSTSANTFTTGTLTAFGRSLLDDANATVARTTLGLGTMATQDASNVNISGGNIGPLVYLYSNANADRFYAQDDTAAPFVFSTTGTGRAVRFTNASTLYQWDLSHGSANSLVLGPSGGAASMTLNSSGTTSFGASASMTSLYLNRVNTANTGGYMWLERPETTDLVRLYVFGTGTARELRVYDDTTAAVQHAFNLATGAVTHQGAVTCTSLLSTDPAATRANLSLEPGTDVQAQDAALQSIADLATSADQMLYTTGSDTYATTAVTAFGRSLLDDANATVARTTLGLVPGTNVQTQDAALQSIADLTTSADQMLYTTGSDAYATTAVTSFGRSLLDDANATVAQATLGLVPGTDVQTQDAALQSIADLATSADQMLYTTGTDTYATTTVTAFGRSLLDDANATVARATLGVVIGTNVQTQDAALQSIADLTTSADQMLYTTGSDTYATTTVTSFGRSLLDDANATVAQATLGLVPGTNVQAQDAALQSIADLTTSADQMLYTTGSDTYATTAVTSFGRSLLDDANATVAWATLGLVPGTDIQTQDAALQSIADLTTSADQMLYTTGSDTYATTAVTAFGRSLLDDANATVAQVTLGLVPGTNVQAQDAGLQSIADLATSADQMLYTTNADTYATATLTSFGRSLLDDANASVARTTLGVVIGTNVQAQDAGLQSIADLATSADQMLYTTNTDTYATTTVTSFGRSLLDDANASVARTTLGVVIGTDVQAQDAGLQSIADLTTSANQMLYTTGSDTYATTAVTAFGRSLLDDTDAEDARVTLGLVPGTDVQAQDAALQSIADLTTSADQMLYTTGADTYATTAVTAFGRSLLDDANATVARATLGLVPGTNVQTQDAALQSIADLTTSADQMLYTTGSDAYATTSVTAFGRSLLDDANATVAKTTLALGTMADQDADDVAITGGTVGANVYIEANAGDDRLFAQDVTATPFVFEVAGADRAVRMRNTVSDTNWDWAHTSGGNLVVSANGSAIMTFVGNTGYPSIVNTALQTKYLFMSAVSGPQGGTIYLYKSDGTAAILAVYGTGDTANVTLGSSKTLAYIANGSITSEGNLICNALEVTDAATTRTNLGVAVGTDVQAYSAPLASIAGLTTYGGEILITTGADTYDTSGVSELGLALIADVSQSSMHLRLGLEIGANVQAYSDSLQSIADLTTSADKMIYATAANTYATTTLSSFARTLLDDADAETARATLGITGTPSLGDSLTSIDGLTVTTDQILYSTGANTFTTAPITSFGRSLIDDADASAARTTLGVVIGTNVQAYDAGLTSIAGLTTAADKMIYTTASDVYATTDLTSFGRSLIDDADASAGRTTLGVVIGTNVQAYDAGLTSIAGLTTAADKMIYTTASDTYATTDLTSFGRSLIDDADASAARTTLGLGTLATSSKTMPSGTVVGTTDTQTLSSKSLTAPIITRADAVTYGGSIEFERPETSDSVFWEVAGSGTARRMRVFDGTNADEPMSINADSGKLITKGAVQIANATPGAAIYLGTNAGFQESVGSGRTRLVIKGSGTATGNGAGVIQFATSGPDADVEYIGGIEWRDANNTQDASDNAKSRVALISSVLSGTTAGDRGGALTFQTKADSATNTTIRMVIDRNGNVGVGTLAPLHTLDVSSSMRYLGTGPVSETSWNIAGTTSGAALMADTGTSVWNGGGLIFGANNGDWRFAGIRSGVRDAGGSSVGDLSFFVRNATGDANLTMAMRIHYTGHVAIGTTAPATKLHVQDGDVMVGGTTWASTGDHAFVYFGNANVVVAGEYGNGMFLQPKDTNKPLFVQETSGNVGINTSSPIGILDVNGSTRFLNAGTGPIVCLGTTVPFQYTTATGGSPGRARLVVKGVGTASGNGAGLIQIATSSADADSEYVGGIEWRDSNNTQDADGNAKSRIALIAGSLSGTTANDRGGLLTFSTKADAATNSTERMRIDRNGNVGIGQTSPLYSLDVNGWARAMSAAEPTTTSWNIASPGGTVVLGDTNNAAWNGGGLIFAANSGAWRFASIRGGVRNGSDNTYGDLMFYVRNATTDANVSLAMRVCYTGNVAIGQSDPTTKLHVQSGDILSGGATWGSSGNRAYMYAGNTNIALVGEYGSGIFLQPYNTSNPFFVQETTGNVGINTTTVSSTLTVNGDITCISLAQTSDMRIKCNIADIDDSVALEQLNLIEPKTYDYIDKKMHGDGTVIGFLAQQVANVIPHAVNIVSGFIPSIYKAFDFTVQTITTSQEVYTPPSNLSESVGTTETVTTTTYEYTMTLDAAYEHLTVGNELHVNDNLRGTVVSFNSSSGVLVLKTTMQIHKDGDTTVFIHGPKVDDFHVLNKDYIFTIVTAAAQELYRKYTTLKSDYDAYKANAVATLTALQDDYDAYKANAVATLTALQDDYDAYKANAVATLTVLQDDYDAYKANTTVTLNSLLTRMHAIDGQ